MLLQRNYSRVLLNSPFKQQASGGVVSPESLMEPDRPLSRRNLGYCRWLDQNRGEEKAEDGKY